MPREHCRFFGCEASGFFPQGSRHRGRRGRPPKDQKKNKMQNCKSGSCANVVMTFNDDLYVINVGDSRAIGSKNNGAVALDLSQDHKPSEL